MSNLSTLFVSTLKPQRLPWLSISTLTLGMIACSVIFAIFNAAFFQALPIRNEAEVVALNTTDRDHPGQVSGWSYLNFVELRQTLQAQRLIDSMVALEVNERTLAAQMHAPNQPVRVALATQGLTRTLGVVPILGRDFSESEEVARGVNDIVPMLISEALWRTHFDARPDVLGRTLYLDGQARRVVGVVPTGLIADSLDPIDCWVSSAEGGDSAVPGSANASRSYPYLSLALVRLASGTSSDLFSERVAQSFKGLVKNHPAANADRGIAVASIRAYLMRSQQPLLQLLLAMAVVVALMVCLNLANVSLARVAKRAAEFQTRIHLGASRSRLLLGVTWENIRLALLASVLALPLVALSLRLAEPLIRSQLENLGQLRLDWSIVVFTLTLSLAIAMVSGIASMLFVVRLQRQSVGGSSARSIFGSRSQQSVRKFLVISQLALTFCLLISASLLVQRLRGLASIDPGFAYSDRVVLSLQFDGDSYAKPEQLQAAFDALKTKLRELPGVLSVSFAQATPLGESNNSTQFNRPNKPYPSDALPDAGLRFVDEDYAASLAIGLREGRFFASHDRSDSAPVVVVNQAFVKAFLPDASPLGQSLKLGWGGDTEKTIIGVLDDVRHTGLNTAPQPEFYVPLSQFPLRSVKLVVHVSPGAEKALAGRIRASVSAFDPQIGIGPLSSLAELREAKLAQPTFLATAITCMALIALALGAFGLFALLSYLLQLRAGEFALRLALGAQRQSIWLLLYRQLAMMWLSAVAIGLVIALLAPSLLQHWLVDWSGSGVANTIAANSFSAWLAALLVLSLAMAAACLGPSIRATNTNLRDQLNGT